MLQSSSWKPNFMQHSNKAMFSTSLEFTLGLDLESKLLSIFKIMHLCYSYIQLNKIVYMQYIGKYVYIITCKCIYYVVLCCI